MREFYPLIVSGISPRHSIIISLRDKLRPPEMVVDLGEEEDAVTDPAGVSPALKPGEGGVSPHLLAPSIRRGVSAATVLRIQYRARVLLHPDNKVTVRLRYRTGRTLISGFL